MVPPMKLQKSGEVGKRKHKNNYNVTHFLFLPRCKSWQWNLGEGPHETLLASTKPCMGEGVSFATQLEHWQLKAYFLVAQKLPTRHPLLACVPLLPPLPYSCPQSRRPACPCSVLLTLLCCLPFPTGLVRSSGMFGPTLGFLLGSFCASLWVDIGVVDIGKKLLGSALSEKMVVCGNLHAKKYLLALLL